MQFPNKYSVYRKIALLLAIIHLLEAMYPLHALALTTGPAQPETLEFEPVGTTQMVDLFTGDFTYNIPLFELPGPDGGYPFNLSYHSGINMDQEATWVGLGWTMNHGAINRSVQGIPDDFDGEPVEEFNDMLPDRTVTVNANGSFEFLGFEKRAKKLDLKLGFSVIYNNYRGWGMGANLGFKYGAPIRDANGGLISGGNPFGGGLSITTNSFEGASINSNFSFGKYIKKISSGVSQNLSIGFNSRQGLTTLGAGINLSKNVLSFPLAGYNYRTEKIIYNPGISQGYSSTLEKLSFELGTYKVGKTLGERLVSCRKPEG